MATRGSATKRKRRTPIHVGDEVTVAYPSGATLTGVVTAITREAPISAHVRAPGSTSAVEVPLRWCTLATP